MTTQGTVPAGHRDDSRATPWWRNAVIYQIYPRSFADGNGDGIGDLAGIRNRLAHLASLGVDAVWFSPWYPSPMADAGYDVADFRDIDPVFGTLAEAEALIGQAHALDLRVIVDVVPNHCSAAHPWFVAALAAGQGAPERDRFWFRPGRGPAGDLPPTDLRSIFGGPAWTRITEPDGDPGEWYLHLFAPEQPDFNWGHPRVWAEFEDILRFWFDRGVDGIRIDSAAVLMKDSALNDAAAYTDRDAVHDVYRAWRRVADSYDGQRALIGEVWLPDRERFANYLRHDELHTAFNFDFLCCPWDAKRLRACIDETLAAHVPVGAPATWVLSNHDVTRHVTRYGREDTSFSFESRREGVPTDLRLGERRARAAVLLTLALPGSAYLYQGEELGLWEVEDIPDALRQDPMWTRSGHENPGRDGCRVPLPWSGARQPFGFSTARQGMAQDGPALDGVAQPGTARDGTATAAGCQPWLPQPDGWATRTVEAQSGDPASMLELYRLALSARGARASHCDAPMRWLDSAQDVLIFARDPGFLCVVNLSPEAVELPAHVAVLIASCPLTKTIIADGVRWTVPTDGAVWLSTSTPTHGD